MKFRAFTLIELLVVISVIGLLSSVVLASLTSARMKARDTRRMEDMRTIMTALNLFYDKYGCLPRTGGGVCDDLINITYAEGGTDGDFGYDTSSTGGFMSFLVAAGMVSEVPVDPINNSTYRYRYYCYAPGQEAWGKGVYLSYFKESTGGTEIKNLQWDDNTICK